MLYKIEHIYKENTFASNILITPEVDFFFKSRNTTS